MSVFNGVKVFSATKAGDRDRLGELVTDWIRSHPHCEIVDRTITQSSDEAFHCLVITLFYNEDLAAKEASHGNGSTRARAAAQAT